MRKYLRKNVFGDQGISRKVDIFLFGLILISVGAVILDSVESIKTEWHREFELFEVILTVVFTSEYLLRIYSHKKPLSYIFSFFGIIDLLTILPAYISIFVSGAESMMVIRSLRLLRMFRVLKVARYVNEGRILVLALKSAGPKINLFFSCVFAIVLILGALMYLVEGEDAGFYNIPQSMYWAIVTMTTVGYGDIHPVSPAGKVVASVLMLLGYGILAVPTGILTAEISNTIENHKADSICPSCNQELHSKEAHFCNRCGSRLKLF